MSISEAVRIAETGMTFGIVRQSGLFPTMKILNSFFQCGIDDAELESTIQWEPFTLSATEYDSLYKFCKRSMGPLTIDGLDADDYSAWFTIVALRMQGGSLGC